MVLECVGHETPFTQAIQAVRAGGTVASVGVYVEPSLGFPAREAFFKDLTLKMGICNARNYMTPLLAAGAGRQAQAVADHHPHDGARRRAEGLRDLRPEGGSRDQGDAPALSQERASADFFRRSSRMRRQARHADAPWICATISPRRSITTVYGVPLKPKVLPIVSRGSSATG